MSPKEHRRKRRRRILQADIDPGWVELVGSKIELTEGLTGCMRWTASWTGFSDRHDGRPTWYGLSAAKVVWIMRNREPWPEGHHAAHLCRTRWCVNPFHILPMTPEDHADYDRDHESHAWSPHEIDNDTITESAGPAHQAGRDTAPSAGTYALSGDGVF